MGTIEKKLAMSRVVNERLSVFGQFRKVVKDIGRGLGEEQEADNLIGKFKSMLSCAVLAVHPKAPNASARVRELNPLCESGKTEENYFNKIPFLGYPDLVIEEIKSVTDGLSKFVHDSSNRDIRDVGLFLDRWTEDLYEQRLDDGELPPIPVKGIPEEEMEGVSLEDVKGKSTWHLPPVGTRLVLRYGDFDELAEVIDHKGRGIKYGGIGCFVMMLTGQAAGVYHHSMDPLFALATRDLTSCKIVRKKYKMSKSDVVKDADGNPEFEKCSLKCCLRRGNANSHVYYVSEGNGQESAEVMALFNRAVSPIQLDFVRTVIRRRRRSPDKNGDKYRDASLVLVQGPTWTGIRKPSPMPVGIMSWGEYLKSGPPKLEDEAPAVVPSNPVLVKVANIERRMAELEKERQALAVEREEALQVVAEQQRQKLLDEMSVAIRSYSYDELMEMKRRQLK